MKTRNGNWRFEGEYWKKEVVIVIIKDIA